MKVLDMPTNFAAGQNIRCTVKTVPNNHGGRMTIERLMRRDPEAKKDLKHAHHVRQRRLNVYVRGNRWWTSRENPAKVVHLVPGATWTMPFTFDIAGDLSSVESYLAVEKA
jgi:hypothetical protein